MTTEIPFGSLASALCDLRVVVPVGRVTGSCGAAFRVGGLAADCRTGDRVEIRPRGAPAMRAEVLRLGSDSVEILPETGTQGVAAGDEVHLIGQPGFFPDESWIGRIVDADGQPLDGRPLGKGIHGQPLIAPPPDAAARRAMGDRLETGFRLFNTLLPLARGQRVGLFAGSGIGKSTLIGKLARNVETDVAVIGLVGERGRELRGFVENSLGPEGLARSVVVVATSDKSAQEKRRAAWAAMAVAEHFRDRGRSVLLVVDSLTRFAEAHRDVALAAGESPSMRGFPPSVSQMIMSLCERAGPGPEGAGDITALFSVLVAASDMDEPIADIVRGVLDGHVVLDRAIAERGRFPAVDVSRSVSRSLPDVANADENALILRARQLLGAYEASELMIRAGLYADGSDPVTDDAIAAFAGLDRFFSEDEHDGAAASFAALESALAPEGVPQSAEVIPSQ